MTKSRDTADSINRIDSSAADATAITIDSSENVGIGVTPEAWGSVFQPVLRVGLGGGVFGSSVTNFRVTSNVYYDSAYKYIANGGASQYEQDGGVHLWYTAPSGSANGALTLTERMRMDSSGQVGIGTTSPSRQLHLNNSSDHAIMSITGGTSNLAGVVFGDTADDDVSGILHNNSGNYLYFNTSSTERMRIRDDGNVAVGGVGAASVKLFAQDTSATNYTLYAQNSSGSYNGGIFVAQSQRAATSAYSLMQGYASTDLEFNFRGDGNAFADGSFTGGGADYAEMFEWDDANSSNEDRRGYSVVLTNGNKIRKATSDDAAADIIGIVSANPTVLGDSAWNMWDEKYNKDDFGGYVLESYTITEWTEPAVFEDVEIEAVLDEEGNEIEPARTEQRKVSDEVEHSYETDKIPSDLTVPSDAVVSSVDADGNTLERRQLNSNYDDTQTYTPREERQEWDAVGMMGKLRMRSGQPTGDRWIKMRDITSDIEEWLVR